MRAEEGDETIGELADEAAKTKKELRESTETGEKVQKARKGRRQVGLDGVPRHISASHVRDLSTFGVA